MNNAGSSAIVPAEEKIRCPYTGLAPYWFFFNEKVDLEEQERPKTRWS